MERYLVQVCPPGKSSFETIVEARNPQHAQQIAEGMFRGATIGFVVRAASYGR